MIRIEVIEGPLRGEPPKKIVDALVMDEDGYQQFEQMRKALESIRDLHVNGTATGLNAKAIAKAALENQPLTSSAWDALRDRNGA